MHYNCHIGRLLNHASRRYKYPGISPISLWVCLHLPLKCVLLYKMNFCALLNLSCSWVLFCAETRTLSLLLEVESSLGRSWWASGATVSKPSWLSLVSGLQNSKEVKKNLHKNPKIFLREERPKVAIVLFQTTTDIHDYVTLGELHAEAFLWMRITHVYIFC